MRFQGMIQEKAYVGQREDAEAITTNRKFYWQIQALKKKTPRYGDTRL